MKRILKKILRVLIKFAIHNKMRVFLLKVIGIKMGKDVYIAEGLTLACDLGYENNLEIQDRVSIGPNVTFILTSNPNNSNLKKYAIKYPFIEIKGNITVMNDTWIGANSLILPNVIIGQFAIVGAGSVVTRNIPAYSVVAGVPAKEIRKLEVLDENFN